MSSRFQPPIQEHESFAGDHSVKESTHQGDSGNLPLHSKRAPFHSNCNNLETAFSSSRYGSTQGQNISDSLQATGRENGPASELPQIPNPFCGNGYPDFLPSVHSDTSNPDEEVPAGPSAQFLSRPARNPFRKAFTAPSSSFTRYDQSEVSPEPRACSGTLKPVKKHTPGPLSVSFQDRENSSFKMQPLLEPKSNDWPRVRSRTGQPSLQDGSTIENIYRHYKGSDAESFTSPNRPTLSSSRGLPHMTSDNSLFSELDEGRVSSQLSNHQHGGCLSREHTAQLQEYVPRIAKHGLPRSTARNDMSSVATSDDQEASSLASSTNVRSQHNQPSQRSRPQRPLQQAIMESRRQIDVNMSSSDGRSTSQGDKAYHSTHHISRIQGSRDSDPIIIDDEFRRLAEPVLFYNRASINPNWRFNDDGVRVPIQDLARPAQHHHEQSAGITPTQEDDREDWETVDTETSHRAMPYRPRLGNGTTYQTASSFAESSDIGSFTTFESMSRFGSTERIIQHPGDARHEGPFSQRELKQGNIPIIAPSSPFKVNGYPQDSLRAGLAYPYITPSPLTDSHKHPFNSQPPEVMSPRSRNPFRLLRCQQGRNRVEPSSSSIHTDEVHEFPRAHLPTPKVARATDRGLRMTNQHEDDADSIFSTQSSLATERPHHLGHGGRAGRPRSSDWDFTTSFAGPGNYQHYGSRENVDSSNGQVQQAQGDGFTEATLYAGGRQTRNSPHHIAIQINGQENRPQTRSDMNNVFETEEPQYVEENPAGERIAHVCLIVCFFMFPPLLPFIGGGCLDIIMCLLTCWRVRSFSKSKKCLAWFLSVIWIAMLICGAIGFLFYEAAKNRPSQPSSLGAPFPKFI